MIVNLAFSFLVYFYLFAYTYHCVTVNFEIHFVYNITSKDFLSIYSFEDLGSVISTSDFVPVNITLPRPTKLYIDLNLSLYLHN